MIAQTALAADIATTRQAELLATATTHRTTLPVVRGSPVAFPAAAAVILALLLIAVLVLGSVAIAPAFGIVTV